VGVKRLPSDPASKDVSLHRLSCQIGTTSNGAHAMQINTFALLSSSVLLTSTLALAGGAEQVTLRLDTVQAKPGELVPISISMETTELVGGFEFTLSAEGNAVTEIGWDGPLFSNGWDGWDTQNADNSRTVSAACIFTEDQVDPGDYLLVNAFVQVPEDAQPGSFIEFEASNSWFANYGFEMGDVLVVNGGIEVLSSADFNGNGIVGPEDLGRLLGFWGMDGEADLNGDSVVDGEDLSMLLSVWGTAG
jgi:hypothetical protein